jgi:hypothetical protein
MLSTAALLAFEAAVVPLQTYDDPLWYTRGLRPVWRTEQPHDYKWAVDLPGGCRLVYGLALRASGADDLPNHPTDYSQGIRENALNQAPADAVFVMRACNYAAFLAAMACLWYAASLALGRTVLALACLTPFLVSFWFPTYLIAQLGPDPFLILALCAFLAVWLKGHLAAKALTPPYILALVLLGGICVWTKQNGALAPLAYAGYALFHGRGPYRVATPLVALGGAFGVFYALSAPFYGHAPQEVIANVLARRHQAMAVMGLRYPAMMRQDIVHHAIESWPLVPLAIWLIWSRRRERWFPPVAWWGMTLWLATVFTINRPSYKYLVPANLGLYFVFAVCVVSLVSQARLARAGDPPPPRAAGP